MSRGAHARRVPLPISAAPVRLTVESRVETVRWPPLAGGGAPVLPYRLCARADGNDRLAINTLSVLSVLYRRKCKGRVLYQI